MPRSCSLLFNGSQIGTAAAAMMAIRILLDHGVCESRIVFITFLVAGCGGVSVLRRAFPGVRFVTGTIDNEWQDVWLDGIGDAGQGRHIWLTGIFLASVSLSSLS